MFTRLLTTALGGTLSAATQLNEKAALQGRDSVFLFRAGVPQFNPDFRLSPAPRFVFSWTGFKLKEVYIQDLREGDEFTIKF